MLVRSKGLASHSLLCPVVAPEHGHQRDWGRAEAEESPRVALLQGLDRLRAFLALMLRSELAKHEREEGAQAVKTLQQSNAGTFLSLGAALIALMALFWRYHRTEQRWDASRLERTSTKQRTITSPGSPTAAC